MNIAAKPKSINWVKIGCVCLLLLVAGYKYYQSNIAAKPADNGNSNQVSDDKYKVNFEGDDSKKKTSGNGYDITFDPMAKSGNKPKGKSANQSSATQSSGKSGAQPSGKSNAPFLTSVGGRNLESPGGLVYGMGGGGEHRTDHVLRHAEDQPNRPTHGVFNAKGDDVFRLIDEAYGHVKSKSKQLKKSEKSRGNMAYVIDMKRKIGFKGGQSGKRNGHPALYKVKLILAGGNRVITAYPY